MDFDTPITGNESCVDTVRALHQTIVTLRTALERSRSEILELKSRNWADNSVEDTIRNLSIENHVLRQNVANNYPNKSKQPKKVEKSKIFKKKGSKEQIEGKKVETSKKSVKQEYDYTNVQVSSENISANKTKKSVENKSLLQLEEHKSKLQLTKSKTVCYSHIYEGDKQISTASSLQIKSVKIKNSDQLKKTGTDSPALADYKVEDNKTHKPKQNLQFKEEVIDDNVTVSRRGSISDFTTEEHDATDELNLKQYVECISKSRELIETTHLKRAKSLEQLKKTSEINHRKSPSKQGIKKERTFTKSKVKVPDENKIDGDLAIISQKSRRTSSILGEQVELVLKQQYPGKDTSNVSEGDELNEAAVQDRENIIGNVERNQKDILTAEQENIKANEGIVDKIEDTKAKGNVKDEENDVELCEIKDTTIVNKDNVQETNKEDENVKISDTKVNVIDSEKDITEIQQDISREVAQYLIENINPLQNKAEDISQQNSSNEGEGDTLKSSENSTYSSTQKNIEISVKIYKGSKKPIEIDIQTKKRKHHKKKKEQSKMNDKSQNTSFDKDYAEAPIVNQISTNEIRTINNASTDSIVGNILQNDVDQEVDDIELIFTTDDTKETDFKEELVPIDAYAETQLLQCPLSDYEEKQSAEASDRELEDDVFNDNFENENQENCNFQSQTYDFRRENSQLYNSKSDNSINHEDKSLKSYYSYQDSSFENKSLEKDESFDRFEEKTRIIETDISKIGIQDVEYNMGRRNTCPNPIQYRPIMHREALGRGLNSRKCRPILAHSNAVRKESGAQTDISALPGSSWRSESSLGHKVKVGDNFTTLPSKFPHPGSRLRLSEKTVEARRVLLSDIGFTSMVPELSRSADHLCPPVIRQGLAGNSYGQFLRTTDLYSPAYTSQKFVWTTTTPSEGSHTHSRYSSQYPLSSPPVPTRRCSAPVSPSKKTTVMKNTPSKVRFANGSLPELRGDWTAAVDSGESTDSLVEEAEIFLRRSIDCLAPCKDVCYKSDIKMSGVRRASAPEPARDNVPPQGWQPFLPRVSRDLHLDYWVKVISPEGRVRGGRVRYVGPLMNQTESFVGVQLSTPDGHSDGTYNTRRYFNCEPYHGLFVPFKKIIMGWRP